MLKLWRLLVAGAGLSCAIQAFSQTTPIPLPITGNLGAVSGTGQPYAGVSIQLQNCASPISITGFFGIVNTGYQIRASSSGQITGSVWPNDLITCNGTTGNSEYNVTLMNNGTPSGTPQCYQVTSTQGAWNMNTQQPIPCSQQPPNPQDAQFRNLNVTGCFSVDGGGCVGGGTGTVTSVAMTVPSLFTLSGSPITTSGTFGLGLSTQAANQFFAGPCSGGGTPAFRFICTFDSTAALAADPNFTWNVNTLNSATINNTGTIFTQNIVISNNFSYATDCSTAGNQAFSLKFISNGTFTGPAIAPVVTSGVCPTSFTLGPWATDTLSVQDGGGLVFSNCGANDLCPSSSPNLSQQVQYVPTAPTAGSGCPGTPFPGPTNQPIWSFSANGSIDFCSNTTGATWVNKVP
jgi:hypothetical protein